MNEGIGQIPSPEEGAGRNSAGPGAQSHSLGLRTRERMRVEMRRDKGAGEGGGSLAGKWALQLAPDAGNGLANSAQVPTGEGP